VGNLHDLSATPPLFLMMVGIERFELSRGCTHPALWRDVSTYHGCIYTIPLELILSKIPDFEKCRACGAALLPASAAAARKRGLGERNRRSRLRFRSPVLWTGSLKNFLKET